MFPSQQGMGAGKAHFCRVPRYHTFLEITMVMSMLAETYNHASAAETKHLRQTSYASGICVPKHSIKAIPLRKASIVRRKVIAQQLTADTLTTPSYARSGKVLHCLLAE